ncbi:MAG: class I tRNA ligase family protein [Planctomycetaceae bacterium]|nr:class I tRNA ligase family protein [Planctomycetaceae bacterium]
MHLEEATNLDTQLTFSELGHLPLEDRWLLSRLATVSTEVTNSIEEYHFAEAARILYSFAWDEFCSAYLELCKPRLQDPTQKQQACRMLLLGLDTILRLLHPIMPFVTEEIWQHLSQEYGSRTTPWDQQPIPPSIMLAPWPTPPDSWQDRITETQFHTFLQIVTAVREIRSRQNVPPRTSVDITIRTPPPQQNLLTPMTPALEAMAACEVVALGPDVEPIVGAAEISAADWDIFVDLADFIDIDAEIQRISREVAKLETVIKVKRGKLGNEKFVANAPPQIVEKEREQLAEFEDLRSKQDAILSGLRTRKPGNDSP